MFYLRIEPPPGYTGPRLDHPAKRQKLEEGDDNGEGKNGATVFLSNLDFEVDEDTINSLMGEYIL